MYKLVLFQPIYTVQIFSNRCIVLSNSFQLFSLPLFNLLNVIVYTVTVTVYTLITLSFPNVPLPPSRNVHFLLSSFFFSIFSPPSLLPLLLPFFLFLPSPYAPPPPLPSSSFSFSPSLSPFLLPPLPSSSSFLSLPLPLIQPFFLPPLHSLQVFFFVLPFFFFFPWVAIGLLVCF